MVVTWKKLAYEDDVILETLADANSVLYAVSDNTPAALAMAASTFVARLAAGNVVAATVAEMQTVLDFAAGATANAKAIGSELDTGTDDAKFATAKAIKDSHNVPSVVPSDDGKVLTSNGTDWVSEVPAAPTAHDLLAASHGDCDVDTVTAGDLIIGNDTPKWAELAISVPAAGLINHLGVANGETTPSWKALFDATVPTVIGVSDVGAVGTAVVAARRDHQHESPATFTPSSHALSGHSVATADLSLGGYQIDDQVLHTVANEAGRLGLTPLIGKICWQTDVLAAYICTIAA